MDMLTHWYRLAVICALFLSIAPSFSSEEGQETLPEETVQEVAHESVTGLRSPVCVYNIWSAYDELSDNVALTEELAMRQFDAILRLRNAGVRFDYFVMDAFWFDRKGKYMTWRKPHWPNGPDQWLRRCQKNALKPGLWFAVNSASPEFPVPEWADSLDAEANAYCMFHGSFLPGFMDVLQYWYDRGVRLFKFDFVRMWASAPAIKNQYSRTERVAKNSRALRAALSTFRERNPDAVLVAFNGFGGETRGTAIPVRKTVDLAWLEVFDTLYCGDPRTADVPTMNFWRSVDIYSDHMVRYYELNGLPLRRIDNTGFMIGTTGTCYQRGTQAWKGALILTLARGGWMNVYHGNLELLSAEDATWFAKVQHMYLKMQETGHIFSFGGLPGFPEVYGFAAVNSHGALFTVVNATQSIRSIELPRVSGHGNDLASQRAIFRDQGFEPVLHGGLLTVGPEQLAVVATGQYAHPDYDLGVQDDVIIPYTCERLPVDFQSDGENAVKATIMPPHNRTIRVIMRQTANGMPCRVSGGSPPNGVTMDKILQIEATQAGRPLSLKRCHNKALWSGLSWAAGELRKEEIHPNQPITVRCASTHETAVSIECRVYRVAYGERESHQHSSFQNEQGQSRK